MSIPPTIENILLMAAVLLLLGVTASKISSKLGVPALLLFLVVGMLVGSEGIGGIYFDDAWLAQFLGVVALAFILFAGGLDTDWRSVRPVLTMGLTLATAGVLISAIAVGLFATMVLGFSLLEGLLLGAIISSTDAAAVFAVLRSKGVRRRSGLAPLIEFESGSNDPMAVFLTIGVLGIITPAASVSSAASAPAAATSVAEIGSALVGLVPQFVVQMVLGAGLGLLLGRGIVLLVNRIRLDREGLYPALTMALVALVYGGTTYVGGNGFLAVYIAGLVMGNSDFVHKRSLARFHDGLAWLMQIAMFLTLGLLVFPSHILPVIGPGLLVALFLMLVARPLSVFICLHFSRLTLNEKAFVGWVGLRGAVPIVLATFPLLAGVPQADTIFNMVFFIVLLSVLLQGTTLGVAARLLRVEAATPSPDVYHYPLEFVPMLGTDSGLAEIEVPRGSPAIGRTIMELGLPRGALVVVLERDDERIVPSGATVIEAEDKLLILANESTRNDVLSLVQGAAVSTTPLA